MLDDRPDWQSEGALRPFHLARRSLGRRKIAVHIMNTALPYRILRRAERRCALRASDDFGEGEGPFAGRGDRSQDVARDANGLFGIALGDMSAAAVIASGAELREA